MSKAKNLTTCMMPVLLLAVLCTAAAGKIIYVDDDSAGANDGSSWADAYTYLQEALADAKSGEKPVEIRIGQGIYRPNQGLLAIPEFDWRTTTFQLINGVTLKGGYAGFGESDPNARDAELYETILSGDLNGDDNNVNDPCDLLTEPTRAENSYTVVTGADDNCLLDGFTISGGNADGSSEDSSESSTGGGMYIESSSMTITNCIFRNNAARTSGGGIFSVSGRGPTLNNCIFIWNYSGSILQEVPVPHLYGGGGGMYNQGNSPTFTNCSFIENSSPNGGGMYNHDSSPTLTNCKFSGNQAPSFGGGMYNVICNTTFAGCIFTANSAERGGGGGMYNSDCNATFTDCIFTANSAKRHGGGMDNMRSSLTLTNCTFCGNSTYTGGGIHSLGGDTISLTNCTFAQNSAQNGKALYSLNLTPSNFEFISCILWDGGKEISYNYKYTTITITHSNIQGGWSGEEGYNIDADPMFAALGYWADVNDPNIVAESNDPNTVWVDGDYHLKSQAGRWDPNSGSWVKDDVTSPCIDAGDPNSDFSGETWPHGGRINMGAYGGTHQASMSLETGGMSLPNVAFIFSHRDEEAEDFESLLGAYGCSTTLIKMTEVTTVPLDSYDLIIVADDTQHQDPFNDPNAIAAIDDSGKPIVGLGDGGYDFFGLLGLWIGNPNGGHGSKNSIEVIDPNSTLFSTPYLIEIPQDKALQLYTETKHVGLYLWPMIPDSVTVLGKEVDAVNYFPLAMQHNRYLLWGFTESPDNMTDLGKTLFINVVIWTANEAWESED